MRLEVETNTLFGTWLLGRMKDKDYTVVKFCEDTGFTRTSIYNYLKDVNRPTDDCLEKLCSALGADINEAKGLFTPRFNGRPIGSKNRI